MCDIVSCFAHLATEVFGMASVARVARVQLFSKKVNRLVATTLHLCFFCITFVKMYIAQFVLCRVLVNETIIIKIFINF